jgi:long-chain acyl-CoA synthetase
MDVSHLLDLAPAPCAVFDRLATHRHRVRFQVRHGDSWKPITWGQFAMQIRGVARWLVEHELEAGERIAIYAPNSVAWAAAALGAQTAGAVFVPIYPASTPEQVAYILDHAEIRYAFVAGKDQIARLEKARSLVSVPPEVVAVDDLAFDEAAQRDAAAPTLVDARLGALSLDQPAQCGSAHSRSTSRRRCSTRAAPRAIRRAYRSRTATSARTAPTGSSATRRCSRRATAICSGCR